jgi:hypothetical protein
MRSSWLAVGNSQEDEANDADPAPNTPDQQDSKE